MIEILSSDASSIAVAVIGMLGTVLSAWLTSTVTSLTKRIEKLESWRDGEPE